MIEALREWLLAQGLSPDNVSLLIAGLSALFLLGVCVLVTIIAKRLVLHGVRTLIKHTQSTWDDVFLEQRVFDRLSHLAPALVLHIASPVAFADYPSLIKPVQVMAIVYMIVVGMAVLDALLNAGFQIYNTFEIAKRFPIKGFVQVAKIIIYFLGGIFILAELVSQSPMVFLSGLGAFTAVLLLVFKDSILGLVAGIQLMTNNMVRPGDWIEMPKYGADGDVIDITLTTVKVQNWDKTITTIPAYALIADSFKNWRGMQESGGRRIKRSINIDVSTIRFCDKEMVNRFRKFHLLRDYLDQKEKELESYNKEHQLDDDAELINRPRLTNVGCLRAYLTAYLRNHPMINKNMTFLVRQLAISGEGLPIEIYVFSSDTRWANYEAIQAEIFEHILASIPLFDLRVFQKPTGADFRGLAKALDR